MANTPEGRQLTELHRLLQVNLSTQSMASTRLLWSTMDPRAGSRAMNTWLKQQVALSGVFDEKSASAAASYVQKFRAAEGFPAGPIKGIKDYSPEWARKSMEYNGSNKIVALMDKGLTPEAAKAAATSGVMSASQRLALGGGRRVVDKSALTNPASNGWRRVPDGSPCSFCAMLVSRGPAYHSERSAGAGRHWHKRCGCSIEEALGDWTPTDREQLYVDSYDKAVEDLRGEDRVPSNTNILEKMRLSGGFNDSPTPKIVDAPKVEAPKETPYQARRRQVAEEAKAREAAFRARMAAIEKTKTPVAETPFQKSRLLLVETKARDAAYRETVSVKDKGVWGRLDEGRKDRPDPDAFNPDNPLQFYGSKIRVADKSDVSRSHLEDLEKFDERVHTQLVHHLMTRENGGFYIGDKTVPDLDDMGHLRGVQPRGWPPGQSWDNVPGAYTSQKRACMCGGGGKGHGATSLALHEGSHFMDDAAKVRLKSWASDSPAWAKVHKVVSESGLPMNPYYTFAGNPRGAFSEAFAEAHAAFTQHRLSGDVEELVGRSLGRLGRTAAERETARAAGKPVVAHFKKMYAAMERDNRKLAAARALKAVDSTDDIAKATAARKVDIAKATAARKVDIAKAVAVRKPASLDDVKAAVVNADAPKELIPETEFGKDWMTVTAGDNSIRDSQIAAAGAGKYESAFTASEREAREKYSSGETFFDIRAAYTAGKPYQLSDGSNLFDEMDSALAKSKVDVKTTLYRAMKVDKNWIDAIEPGGLIEHKFFVSTTTDFKRAVAYGKVKGKRGQKNVILQILTPEGTHMVPGMADINEWVLKSDVKMTVRRKTDLGDKILVLVDLS